MLEFGDHPKVVGLKQTRKAVKEGRALLVYIAEDADPAVTVPLEELCRQMGVKVEHAPSMARLGAACNIEVGAATVAVLNR